MKPRGNPYFVKGNQFGRKGRGIPKRPVLAQMLHQFAPQVITVIQQMLTSDDKQERWTCAKEILPYLWARKAPMTAQEDKPVVSLADYLAVKPASTTASVHDHPRSDPRPEPVPATAA